MQDLAPILVFLIILLSVGSGYLYFVFSRGSEREAKLHLSQLQEGWDFSGSVVGGTGNVNPTKALIALNGPYADAGLFDIQDITDFKKRQRAAIVWGTFGIFMAFVLGSGGSFSGLLLGTVLGLSFSYLYAERMLRTEQKNFYRSLIFFLPIVMERLVMAVQAGLDIIPAIQAAVQIDGTRQDAASQNVTGRLLLKPAPHDPVTKLLAIVARLSNAGLPFEQALKEITSRVDSTAVKHAFIHLAVAHKEGGELVAPLRELSDATQLYFQETVEEEIAVMPVKATMPLLVTFAGLLIIFITAPILQISKFTKNAAPPAVTSTKR